MLQPAPQDGNTPKLAILTIHGIGNDQHEPNSPHQQRVASLETAIRGLFPDGNHPFIFDQIIWQQHIAPRQKAIVEHVNGLPGLGFDSTNLIKATAEALDYEIKGFPGLLLNLFSGRVERFARDIFPKARGFFLATLGDVAAISFSPASKGSVYTAIQREIKKALVRVWNAIPGDNATKQPIPVLIIAHSFGIMSISNYLWDVERYKPRAPGDPLPNKSTMGIWRHEPIEIPDDATPEERAALQRLIDFVQLKSFRCFHTTGNNMALFMSGIDTVQPFRRPHPDFEWFSFWDRNDVLGWPLKDLEFNAKLNDDDTPALIRPFQDLITEEFPFNMQGLVTHFNYWDRPEFRQHLLAKIQEII